MVDGSECAEKGCKYFNVYYIVQPSAKGSTGWLPVFDLINFKCSHPKVCGKKVSFTDPDEPIGVGICTLKRCPIE